MDIRTTKPAKGGILMEEKLQETIIAILTALKKATEEGNMSSVATLASAYSEILRFHNLKPW
jgi:hypothetical protein